MKSNIGRLSIFVLLASIGQSAWSEAGAPAAPATAAAAPAATPAATTGGAKTTKKTAKKSARKAAAKPAETAAESTLGAAAGAPSGVTVASPAAAPVAAPATVAPAAAAAAAALAATSAAASAATPVAVPTAPVGVTAPVAAPAAAPAVAQATAPAPGTTSADGTRRPMAPPTAAGLTQRWEALGNLLERSSSAKHIEAEGSPESKALQQQARNARAKAKQAIDAGELEKADALLREASQLIFKAERASRSTAIAADKEKTDYVARRNSVQALMTTGRRIAGEEHKSKPEFAQADGLIAEADKLADAGKHADGRVKLDQAYALITSAVRGMREGKEIRADKNFANKAEEYKYEQGRNDDYRGLIADIIADKDSSWTDVAKESSSLRDEADRLAGKNEHEAALKKINESTAKLKSLLRRSGFPIL